MKAMGETVATVYVEREAGELELTVSGDVEWGHRGYSLPTGINTVKLGAVEWDGELTEDETDRAEQAILEAHREACEGDDEDPPDYDRDEHVSGNEEWNGLCD